MHSFRAYLVLSALNPILETEDEDGDTIYTTCDVLDTMAYDHDGLATEPRDVPTMYDINWEGSDEYCADCNKRMPSEYGDSEDSEDAEDA
jgi:hypothetical protein